MFIAKKLAGFSFFTDGAVARPFLRFTLVALLPQGNHQHQHHHRQTEEIYYVLEGHGRMEIAGEQCEVGPGDAIAVPPGAVHTITNTGATNACRGGMDGMQHDADWARIFIGSGFPIK